MLEGSSIRKVEKHWTINRGATTGLSAHDRLSFLHFETDCCYVVQASLKLVVILLPQPPAYWDYKCGPTGLRFYIIAFYNGLFSQ